MATFTPGISSNITDSPTLVYDSDNGTTEITLNLTSFVDADTIGAYIFRYPSTMKGTSPCLPVAYVSATGTFTVSGLSVGQHVFVAVPVEADGKVGEASNRLSVHLGTTQGLDTLLAHLETQVKDMIWQTNPVFGFAVVTDEDPEEVIRTKAAKPCCVITYAGSSQIFPDYPELVEASINLHIFQEHAGGNEGRAKLLGGMKKGDDYSDGKGILEICRKVRKEMGKITTADGSRYTYNSVADGGTEHTKGSRFITQQVMSFRARCYDAE